MLLCNNSKYLVKRPQECHFWGLQNGVGNLDPVPPVEARYGSLGMSGFLRKYLQEGFLLEVKSELLFGFSIVIIC